MNTINLQTKQNDERIKQYAKKMAQWVIAKGITHRAIELRYFGTDSYIKLLQKTKRKHRCRKCKAQSKIEVKL